MSVVGFVLWAVGIALSFLAIEEGSVASLAVVLAVSGALFLATGAITHEIRTFRGDADQVQPGEP